jgi:ABC-type glycerol-3-phosphate transport system substrate-binding protein
VIPAQAAHPDLAWEFIKLASDATAGAEMVSALGAPPVNREAAAAIEDPFVQYIAEQTQNYGMPILDSVMPNPVALTWYRELQQAFSGAKSAQDALAAIQASSELEGP